MEYSTYEPAAGYPIGVIVSGESNLAYDSSGHLLAPALETIGVWNLRHGLCTKSLAPMLGYSKKVTSIASSPSSQPQIASGYADGIIRLWDSERGIFHTNLNEHSKAVTVLRYNKLGSKLASGGKENYIVVWDVPTGTCQYHLVGHSDQVTDLVFLDSGKKLVSSSTDKSLRVWNLDINHYACVQIVSDHRSPIWSIDVDPEERFLVSGSADVELRFYTIKYERFLPDSEILISFGEIERQTKYRVSTVRFNKSGNLLACQVAGKTVEIFSVLNDAETKVIAKSRRRLLRKKHKESAGGAAGGEEGNARLVTATDVFKILHIVRASNKICSISFCPVIPKKWLASLAVSLNNNVLQSYTIRRSSDRPDAISVDLQGHRSVVKSVTLSPDNTLLMSTSHTKVKIWDLTTRSCIRTIDSGRGLCGLILPQNNFAIVGTEEGTIEIIGIYNGMCLEAVNAHGGFVRSIAAIPDQASFLTGGADHVIKFWEYRIIPKPGQFVFKETGMLKVSNVKTRRFKEDVVAVAVSAKYIAVVLFGPKVKVFKMGPLEEYCTLQLCDLSDVPVLCVDISSDGKLMATGSVDGKLRTWDLVFGDIQGVVSAHDHSVMAVQFVRNTPAGCMFSVGKDGLVKYWKADTLELLLTLEGHHGGVWCLAISNGGDFVVTGSQDRSIRRWDRSEEEIILH